MGMRRPSVGDPVIYWGDERGRPLEQAAIVTALSDDEPWTHVRVHVFLETGHAGERRTWAHYSATPMEGRWSWRDWRALSG